MSHTLPPPPPSHSHAHSHAHVCMHTCLSFTAGATMFLSKVHGGPHDGVYKHNAPLPPKIPTKDSPGYMAELAERRARGSTVAATASGVNAAVMVSQRRADVTYAVSLRTPANLESLCTCRSPFIEGMVCKHVTRLCSMSELGLAPEALVHPSILTTSARASYAAGGEVAVVTTAAWAFEDIARGDLLFHALWCVECVVAASNGWAGVWCLFLVPATNLRRRLRRAGSCSQAWSDQERACLRQHWRRGLPPHGHAGVASGRCLSRARCWLLRCYPGDSGTSSPGSW